MAIQVSQQDVTDAETYLVSYLTENIPTADFSPGSAVRDICVTAIAHTFAILRKELATVRALQSLKSVADLPADESVDDAVDAILSNWFVTRRQGTTAQVPVLLHFSEQPAYVTIPRGTQLYAPGGVAFTVDGITDLVVPGSVLETRISETGIGVDYVLRVSATAANVGAAYNLPAGKFSGATAINPYFMYAETETAATGGTGVETTAELLARAPAAISTRTLINERSITHIVTERVASARNVVVVGTGSSEMQRDLVVHEPSNLRLHTGGFTDVYAEFPRTSRTVTLLAGSTYVRADKGAVYLRDSDPAFRFPLYNAVTGAGIKPGHVLKVVSGIDGAPVEYVIAAVTAEYLQIDSRVPFPTATDEAVGGTTYVTYSVGEISNAFTDVQNYRATGYTSQRAAESDVLVLPEGAVYKVRSVVVAGGAGLTAGERTNGTPTGLSFSVEQHASTGQSMRASGAARIRLSAGTATGRNVTVTYDTVTGLPLVDALVSSPSERIIAADMLARAKHPVYVSGAVRYSVKFGAADPGYDAISAAAAAYIESADPAGITVGNLIAYLTRKFDAISSIAPGALDYALYAPDGQVFRYSTVDLVTLRPTPTAGARFIGASELRLAAYQTSLKNCGLIRDADNATLVDPANLALKEYLASLCVSDLTSALYCDPASIVAVLR